MQRLGSWFCSTHGGFVLGCAFAFAPLQSGLAQGFPTYSPEPQQTSGAAAPGLFPATDSAPLKSNAQFPTAEAESSVKTASFPRTETESDEKPARPAGKPVNYQELGRILKQMSLDTAALESRYDFLYRAELEEQQIELFFSVELADEGTQLRIRTWLDPLPASVVSEEPILRLMSRNTQLKRGMHYGFNQGVRRFLLETVLDSSDVTPEGLRASLNDVSREVASSWALWSTAEWGAVPKRVAEKPELDSRAGDISGERFELPVRR